MLISEENLLVFARENKAKFTNIVENVITVPKRKSKFWLTSKVFHRKKRRNAIYGSLF